MVQGVEFYPIFGDGFGGFDGGKAPPHPQGVGEGDADNTQILLIIHSPFYAIMGR